MQSCDERLSLWIAFGVGHQEADATDPPRLTKSRRRPSARWPLIAVVDRRDRLACAEPNFMPLIHGKQGAPQPAERPGS